MHENILIKMLKEMQYLALPWYLLLTRFLSSPQEKNGCYFGRRHFQMHFFLMKMIEFKLKFHWIFWPGFPSDNKPALVQAMAWCRTGNKPLLAGVYTKFSGRLSEEPFPWLKKKFPCILLFKTGQPGRLLNLSEGQIRLDLTSGRPLV